jgi:peptidoglycan hydrolase-like protein with peptidoglycan-binding domain
VSVIGDVESQFNGIWADQPFVQKWEFRNTGSCAWEAGTRLVQVLGDSMGSPDGVPLPRLEPGDSVPVQLELTAPSSYGIYSSYWRLQSASGEPFGPVFTVKVSPSVPARPRASQVPAQKTPTPAATPTSSPEPTRTLVPEPEWPSYRRGDEGPVVSTIQYLLRAAGYALEADRTFGPITEAAVVDFQARQGLSADGAVGQDTWTALVEANRIKPDSRGDAVRALQYLLVEVHGHDLLVDGVFDGRTRDAVRDFQAAYRLAGDGIPDLRTWKYLVAMR